MKLLLIFIAIININIIQTIAQDYSKQYELAILSVVTIYTSDYEAGRGEIKQTGALGAGVLIDSAGYIFTASHVVHTANSIKVKFSNGEERVAQIVTSIPATDVALLKIESIPSGANVAKIGKSENTKIGEQVFLIGAPLGLEYSLSIGHISGKIHKSMLVNGQLVEFIQTDAAINPGNSGGPMFNDRGEVIGIVSYILTESGGFEGIGFAVASSPARKMLFENYSLWTGFDGIFLDNNLAAILNVPTQSGLIVQHVTDNSMASKIGLNGGTLKFNYLGNEILLGGDVVLSVLGISCDSPHNFSSIKNQMENLKPGIPIIMHILRAGKEIELYNK